LAQEGKILENAFKLYETYGLPLEVTEEKAEEKEEDDKAEEKPEKKEKEEPRRSYIIHSYLYTSESRRFKKLHSWLTH